jgi:cytochrome oxidase Cu insertion factor (SCO1/SenC/PrrC family)
MSAEERQLPARASRVTIALVAAVCIAPIVASVALYLLWQPASRVNYGELLAPAQLAAPPLADAAGRPFDLVQLRGKWTYITVDAGSCDAYCRDKLWKMRQIRRTQGKYMERIERLWLIDDAGLPDAALMKEYEGTWAVRAAGSGLLKQLPSAAGRQRDHVYLLDPLGNLVLRYPRNADPSRMRKDLERLLKVSRIG